MNIKYISWTYTNYGIWCHIIFHVTMMNFLMTILMIKFTSTTVDDCNLNDLIKIDI